MAEKTLWEAFNLAEKNPDPGGGIMYCLMYDLDRIIAHREPVVSAIQAMGVKLEEADDVIAVVLQNELSEFKKKKLLILLEELSVLNEAQEYHEVGFGKYNTIEELKSGLIIAYFSFLGEKKQTDAYNLVSKVIPQIVQDIQTSDSQSRFLYAHERRTLDELLSFARRHAKGKYVVIGL